MYIFISKHKTYDIVQSLQHATEGGKAIGRFQSQLSDLDSSSLYETIPYFHDIEKRLKAFYLAVDKDEKGRVQSVKEEIDFCKRQGRKYGCNTQTGQGRRNSNQDYS